MLEPRHTKSSCVTSASVSYKRKHEARAEIFCPSLVCNIQRTSRRPYPSPGVVLQSVLRSARHHRQSQLGIGSIPASLLSITALAKNAMASDCTEKQTGHRIHRALTKEVQSRKKQRPTARLRGSGPLRLAAATRCDLRLARPSSAAPTEGRIGEPRIQSPPFRSGRPALERNRVYPGASSRGSSTG